MRTIATIIIAALILTGCAGTQAERQESADQKFGQAKGSGVRVPLVSFQNQVRSVVIT